MDWRNIPSLSALRAFEAAAHHGSYSAAARALNVTHAAIAQHVRTLDSHFGRPMMRREGTKMVATEDGARLASALSEAFLTIERGVDHLMRQSQDRPLRVATTHSFAENWLVPRIGGFWAAHPGIGLEIVPAPTVVNMRRDSMDVALRFGRGNWSGVDSEPLVSAGYTVIAAPGVVDQSSVQSIGDLKDQHWLLIGAREEEYLWLKDHGLHLEDLRVSRFDTGSLVIQAVRAGNGISVQPRAIIERDLELGALVALYEEDETDLAYHIAIPTGQTSDKVGTFVRWLKAQR